MLPDVHSCIASSMARSTGREGDNPSSRAILGTCFAAPSCIAALLKPFSHLSSHFQSVLLVNCLLLLHAQHV